METPENERQRLAREVDSEMGRLQAALDELEAAISKTWVHRLLLRCCDGLVWLDWKWRAWRQS